MKNDNQKSYRPVTDDTRAGDHRIFSMPRGSRRRGVARVSDSCRRPRQRVRLSGAGIVTALVTVLAFMPALHAQPRQDDDAEGMAARLPQLDFFTGSWRGMLGSTVIEERWSAAEGDNMMGMFRMVKEGEGVFYEFMTIEQAGDTPVLRIRHFSQGLVAWEEKDGVDPYPLVELQDTRAVFANAISGTRLVYTCPSPDRLEITLEKPKDGKTSSQVFRFERFST